VITQNVNGQAYNSPWFSVDSDQCIEVNSFDGTVFDTGLCTGPDVYYDENRDVYFNYMYDPYYRDFFGLDYLT